MDIQNSSLCDFQVGKKFNESRDQTLARVKTPYQQNIEQLQKIKTCSFQINDIACFLKAITPLKMLIKQINQKLMVKTVKNNQI